MKESHWRMREANGANNRTGAWRVPLAQVLGVPNRAPLEPRIGRKMTKVTEEGQGLCPWTPAKAEPLQSNHL
ncbi:MAG: hypothetical protein JO212_20990 [Acetobacteraceae bacterium]|nr:hypothetical protein [Acetobacteraceae bacterium]